MKIIGNFNWRAYKGDLSKIKSIGRYAYLQYCKADLSNLRTIGRSAYLYYCEADLPKLESINGREFKSNKVVSL